jgi:transposase
MIVIGVDVHKHSLTAVAVDELGRRLGEHSGAVEAGDLLAWAGCFGQERLWALEDCRHVSRRLEQPLLQTGERLVRVPPRLTGPERRRGRSRGKSDSLDALAVARVALREPGLEGPRPQEPLLRELKLLVDHRDDLVAERRRCQQRLRWHLHELDPALAVPPGRLGPIERFRSDAQLARHAGVAPLEASSGKQRRHRLDRGGNRQLNCALHRIAVTQGRVHPPARAYLERKQGEGKSRREAIRCLKRQLARTVYTTLKSAPLLT